MRRAANINTAHGFTLIELMIVVALIGMLVAASVIGIGSVFRSKLRSAASRTAAAMRVAFDRATLTGKHIRLAVDMKKGRLWLEGSSHGFSLRKGREQHVTTSSEEAERQEEASGRPEKSVLPFGMGAGGGPGGEGAEGADGEEGGLLGIDRSFVEAFEQDLEPIERPKAYFERLKGPGSVRLSLSGKVRFAALMTPHLEEPATDGVAYVYFFPQGHAEPAIVHVTNDKEDFYSVVLHPLTGQAKIYSCRYRIPERFGEPDAQQRSRASPCEG